MSQTEVTDTSPFIGAKTVYKRIYKLIDWMGWNGHVTTIEKKGKVIGCKPSDEINSVIKALNEGDEHFLKAILLKPEYLDHSH